MVSFTIYQYHVVIFTLFLVTVLKLSLYTKYYQRHEEKHFYSYFLIKTFLASDNLISFYQLGERIRPAVICLIIKNY